MKALIIDDDSVSTKILTYQLRALEILFEEVRNISQANAFIQSTPPDLIYLDLIMPGHSEDGFKFLSERSSNEELKKIPVVVISGKADLATIRKAIALGADGYLIKPIQMKMLRDSIIGIKKLIECCKSKALR